MSYDNPKLATQQITEGPPIVFHRGRDPSTEILNTHRNRMSSADPPGVPNSSYHSNSFTGDQARPPVSVQVVDENEKILFEVCEDLGYQLGCPLDRPVKVVSIVGNTGDGKSHTLNHTFFNGKKIFTTSPSQETCTIGVWAAYAPHMDCILLDTEGMLGTSANHNQHRRLLLKVFAISDVVIYLTKAPRLHADMFTFLADASDSFAQHFRPDLEALAKKTGLPWTPGQLGPAVIVFQETRHTDPLEESQKAHRIAALESSGKQLSHSDPITQTLQERLAALKRNVDSFCSLHYIGTQTKNSATDFKPLCSLTTDILKDTSVRVPRNLEHVFSGLHLLNTRFAYTIPSHSQFTFVEEYFTCPITCESCSVRCCLSVGHSNPHQAAVPTSGLNNPPKAAVTGCKYDSDLKNKLYFCKDCYAAGIKTIVVPKSGESLLDAARYFCSGYVLECKKHGIIYQSRNLWSTNPEPEETPRVHWEVIHVWSGEKTVLQGIHPFSQVLLDSVNAVTKQVSDLTGPPVRLLGDLFADTVAPEHWQPNSTIRCCALCNFEFPDPSTDGLDYDTRSESKLSVQPAGEHQHHLATDRDLPRKPDQRAPAVLLHTTTMNPVPAESPTSKSGPPTKPPAVPNPSIMDTSKHHCRDCGRGVCASCSTGRLPVRGFGTGPVRVCDRCYSKRSGRPANNTHTEPAVPQPTTPIDSTNQNVYTGRKALEICTATVNSVPPVLTMFKDTLKGLARPAYWTPDELCTSCAVCSKRFGPSRRIHHCRACGRGVCEPCSPNRQPVPLRGLDLPHRVCLKCFRSSA